MSQVSRPLQILLAGSLLFLAVWFVALRPKSETSEPAPAQATTPATPGGSSLPGSLGNSVDKARDAGTTSDEANARAGADPTEASGGSSTPATKKLPRSVGAVAAVGAEQASALIVPAKSGSGQSQKATLPADAKRALDRGKVLVLLFWNGKSSDDKFVRAAVRSLSTRKGKVFKDVSSLSAIGRYSAVTNGVPVLGSPTVIVVGKGKKAVSFTGYVDKTNIDQAVLAALG